MSALGTHGQFTGTLREEVFSCRANPAQIRQSRPDSGRGLSHSVSKKFLNAIQVAFSPLDSHVMCLLRAYEPIKFRNVNNSGRIQVLYWAASELRSRDCKTPPPHRTPTTPGFAMYRGNSPIRERILLLRDAIGGWNPKPHTPHSIPHIPHPKPQTPHPTPHTPHPTPHTPHLTPHTPHPTPQTLNPEP